MNLNFEFQNDSTELKTSFQERSALKDRSNEEFSKTYKKKTRKKPAKTPKKVKKKASARKKVKKSYISPKIEHPDFSDFSNFSLNIEGNSGTHTPVVDPMSVVAPSPDIVPTTGSNSRPRPSVSTSTPHTHSNHKILSNQVTLRNKNKTSFLQSRLVDTSLNVSQHKCVVQHGMDVDSCCSQMDKLHVSLSNIAQSPIALSSPSTLHSPDMSGLEISRRLHHSSQNDTGLISEDCTSLHGKFGQKMMDLSSIPSNSMLLETPGAGTVDTRETDARHELGTLKHVHSRLAALRDQTDVDDNMLYSNQSFSKTPIKPCNIDLTKLSDSMILMLTDTHVSDRSRRGRSQLSYDASQSLFEDEFSCKSLRNRKVIVEHHNASHDEEDNGFVDNSDGEEERDLSAIKENEGERLDESEECESEDNEEIEDEEEDFKEVSCKSLRNRNVILEHHSALDVEEDNSSGGNSNSEDEKDLSAIEENEGEESHESEECESEDDGESDDDEESEDNSCISEENEDEDYDEEEDINVTRYELASNPPSIVNASSDDSQLCPDSDYGTGSEGFYINTPRKHKQLASLDPEIQETFNSFRVSQL